jgi:hypothetical protein
VFISSDQALNLLQQHAPRAWCKRLLQWEVLQGALSLYFSAGHIRSKRQAGYYLLDMFPETEGAKPSLALVGQHFGAEVEEKLRSAGCPENPNPADCFGLDAWVDLHSERWIGEPRVFPVGVLIFADELDWQQGIASASQFSLDNVPEFLFEGAEEDLGTADRYAEVDYHLEGMCFEFSAIEMMAPGTSDLTGLRALEKLRPRRSEVGRPRKWDWEGALTEVIKVANTPDGLPDGYGAQASIERAIADWFASTAGSSPPESEIRKRASDILRATRRK